MPWARLGNHHDQHDGSIRVLERDVVDAGAGNTGLDAVRVTYDEPAGVRQQVVAIVRFTLPLRASTVTAPPLQANHQTNEPFRTEFSESTSTRRFFPEEYNGYGKQYLIGIRYRL